MEKRVKYWIFSLFSIDFEKTRMVLNNYDKMYKLIEQWLKQRKQKICDLKQ